MPENTLRFFASLPCSLISSRRSFSESALRSASSYVMRPASYRSNSDWSNVCMPSSRDFFMISLMPDTSPLKIRSEISGEFSITSTAGTRPRPSRRGIRRCATNARTLSERSIRSCARRSSGKKLMMRSSAWLVLLACSVARHRWPVSAKRDRVVHRLALAHFADQDDVGRLAQRVLERDLPAVAIHADLALRDDAVLVLVHELDRVLDRDDVAVAVLVAVAEQRRHRRRLAGAGGADEHHDAALAHDDVLQHRRQAELLELRDVHRDRAQHHADAALLHERVARGSGRCRAG